MQNPFAEQNQMDEMCGGFQLTRTQRFYAFGALFVVGFIVSFLSTFSLFSGRVADFAILFTLGNVISLTATGFLIGFTLQFKKMFEPGRRIATAAFLGTMVLTLTFGFMKIGILALLCCIVQYLALLWYSISYIPFARDAVQKMVGL